MWICIDPRYDDKEAGYPHQPLERTFALRKRDSIRRYEEQGYILNGSYQLDYRHGIVKCVRLTFKETAK